MIAKWAYILIGDDQTGKTTFQKWLIWHLCHINKFDRLHVNQVHPIAHRDAPRKFKTLFTMNRSVQEKMADTYLSMENFFTSHFHDADVCILSSHAHGQSINDISFMINALGDRYYNIGAVFFSNHLNANTQAIARLPWQERISVRNPTNSEGWEDQVDEAAHYFSEMLIRKAIHY
ncbi:MAG: hypothetical protein JWP69_1331 [Flaviaesturariibacter sp.]|nr:hypothetical protein [Flaviaesturariibacter sp.]